MSWMRKIVTTDWGIETIYAQEDWFTGSYIQIGTGKETEYKKSENNKVFDIVDGTARFTIGNMTYDFHKGKTISITKGTKYSIKGINIPKINVISDRVIKDKDISPYKTKE